MNITEIALVTLWKIASHTPAGCVAIIKTLDDMMSDDSYDRELIIEARAYAFEKCQQMQVEENAAAWVGELEVNDGL